MNGRRAKQLRKAALGMATDRRGLQVYDATVYHPPKSPRGLYQALKKRAYREGWAGGPR